MIPEQAAAAGINDVNGLPGLGAAVAECVAKIKSLQFAQCIKTAMDAASFAKSSLVNKVYGTYLWMRDGRASLQAPFKVYCCNGPDQIKVDRRGEWRTAVVEGIGKPPFLFDFDFGDNGEFSRPSALTSDYGATFPYIYDIPGTYNIGVTVIDQNSDKAIADSQITGALKPFSVTVYEDMQLQCCTSSKSAADDLAIELTFSVTGGKKPYTYSIDFGDETRETVNQSIETAYTLKHRYDELNKPKTITLTMTDADGTKITKTHQIEANAAPEAPDFQYDFSAVGGVEIHTNLVLINEYDEDELEGTFNKNLFYSGVLAFGSISMDSVVQTYTAIFNSNGILSFKFNKTGDAITYLNVMREWSSKAGELDTILKYEGSGEIPYAYYHNTYGHYFTLKGQDVCDFLTTVSEERYVFPVSHTIDKECDDNTSFSIILRDNL